MPKEYLACDEKTLKSIASSIANAIDAGVTIYLHGELGTGKTTFTRSFLNALGYTGKVKSPTFTLVEPYNIAGRHVYHFDFYRLKNVDELEQIGIRDYFVESSICIIEWPEKGAPLLPEPDLACYISFAENGRDIRIEEHSERGRNIIRKM